MIRDVFCDQCGKDIGSDELAWFSDIKNNNNNNSDSPPPTFTPTTNPTPINEAKNIEEAQLEAKKQINNLLSTSKVKSSELNKKLWNNFESWEKYLLTLNSREQIVSFMEKMKQAIKNKYDINFQQQKQPPKKPKNKDYLLPIILVVGFVLLVGIASLIVWERKEKISKKKIQKANKNKK